MKKPKVILTQFSAKLDDGSRKTIQRKVICTCEDRGTAELILYRIRDDYRVLTDDIADNKPIWYLSVDY